MMFPLLFKGNDLKYQQQFVSSKKEIIHIIIAFILSLQNQPARLNLQVIIG